jgi:hypothetical protein
MSERFQCSILKLVPSLTLERQGYVLDALLKLKKIRMHRLSISRHLSCILSYISNESVQFPLQETFVKITQILHLLSPACVESRIEYMSALPNEDWSITLADTVDVHFTFGCPVVRSSQVDLMMHELAPAMQRLWTEAVHNMARRFTIRALARESCCSICLEPVIEPMYCVFPCTHAMHYQCCWLFIAKHMKAHNSFVNICCPECRAFLLELV